MEMKKYFDESSHYIMNTYGRYPIVLRKGRGMKVWSSDGKEYLDFVAGVAVNILGHCHPRVVVAIQNRRRDLYMSLITIILSPR
jgi:acetylornithine/succinyldiaminopimelate/putrescine aminotransferase